MTKQCGVMIYKVSTNSINITQLFNLQKSIKQGIDYNSTLIGIRYNLHENIQKREYKILGLGAEKIQIIYNIIA